MTKDELQMSIIEILIRDKDKNFWAAHTSGDIMQLIDQWSGHVIGKDGHEWYCDSLCCGESCNCNLYLENKLKEEQRTRAGLSTKGGKDE